MLQLSASSSVSAAFLACRVAWLCSCLLHMSAEQELDASNLTPLAPCLPGGGSLRALNGPYQHLPALACLLGGAPGYSASSGPCLLHFCRSPVQVCRCSGAESRAQLSVSFCLGVPPLLRPVPLWSRLAWLAMWARLLWLRLTLLTGLGLVRPPAPPVLLSARGFGFCRIISDVHG